MFLTSLTLLRKEENINQHEQCFISNTYLMDIGKNLKKSDSLQFTPISQVLCITNMENTKYSLVLQNDFCNNKSISLLDFFTKSSYFCYE